VRFADVWRFSSAAWYTSKGKADVMVANTAFEW
jgi:hypothetical protein